jgi:iron complex transport system permease protein
LNRPGLLLTLSLMALAAMFMISLLAGAVWLSPNQVLQSLQHPAPDLAALIVTDLRLPRAILAVCIGGALGLCGAVLQGLLRNPLAEPGLLGVSSGAALGAVVAIYFGLAATFAFAPPLLGLVGALVATGITFVFGRGGTLPMILAGAAVSGLAGACTSMALTFAPNVYAANEIVVWLMGSLSDRSWTHVQIALPFIVVGALVLATTGRSLDALSLGEVQAASLGVDLDRLRITVLIGVAMCVGAGTSVSGAIGFIGLVAPHLVRPFVGHQPGRMLLPSAIVGATLLLGADIISRLYRYNGNEIRLGVLTSLIGAPFYFWLILRLRRTAP